ncbi:X-ray repair cross-complementing protein 6 [Chionoecetes opilio]|uniref:X-ray repair cross-complementing protein 6 n=1 Tax=Chionoecetes opilio TaxID=41210 RepID=A0A8J4Y7U5_CHIOP|nr:X-ray repair cross-complementing protein 6 [Chionoecetes opilio]
MGASFDIKKFYKDLIITDDMDEEEEEMGGRVSREMRTLVDPTTRFDELFSRVKLLESKQRVTAKLVFKIAPEVQMGVGLYTLVRSSRKQTKRQLSKSNNEQVRVIRKDHLPRTGELVYPSDREYCAKYGKEDIGFSKSEARNVINVFPPGIELLGFQPKSWLKNLYHYKAAKFIYPQEAWIKGSTKLFSALLERCQTRGVVPLVRIVARRGCNLALAALLPQDEVLDDTRGQVLPQGFIVYHLPMADSFSTSDLKRGRSRAAAKQVDAAKKVVQKLHFDYNVDLFDNPDIETMNEIIKGLALNRDHMDPVADPTVPKMDAVMERAGPALKEFEKVTLRFSDKSARLQATSALMANKRVRVEHDNVDVEIMVKRGQAQQLSVPVLKEWLSARGFKVTGKKKAELMQLCIDTVCA